jgi:hypothetical protein
MQVKSHHFLTAYTGFCAEMAPAPAAPTTAAELDGKKD